MAIPRRLKRQAGRHALVDQIPFVMPVDGAKTPALMAAFTIDAAKAAELLPGNELHPYRIWGRRGLLIISVMNYRVTDIGKYVEFSVGIACTRGPKPAMRLLPGAFRRLFGFGQYVLDLPVSSEVSVKGGKGIWGMPKHQANLDFVVGENTVSSTYDKDGVFALKIEVERPKRTWLPLKLSASNYCRFRGMLMKSTVYFDGKVGFSLFRKGAATLTIGDHPRAQPLKGLDISEGPIFASFLPDVTGLLDDHQESWFLSEEQPPKSSGEGMESVINLGQSQDWLEPPSAGAGT